jgi:hypothetical protein
LAAKAIPNLLQRIPIEAELLYGLLPLAAIEDALRAMGHADPDLHSKINAIFMSRGIDRNDIATATQDEEMFI